MHFPHRLAEITHPFIDPKPICGRTFDIVISRTLTVDDVSKSGATVIPGFGEDPFGVVPLWKLYS
jgi:hypothetical protein